MSSSAPGMIVECPSCGAKNRVRPFVAGQKQAVCGRCRTALAGPQAAPVTLTDSNFDTLVGGSKIPVMIDMWAAWCGPCRMIAPTIDALAGQLSGRVLVGKLNVDANPRTAARFGVQSIPTILVLHNGLEAERIVGVQSKEAILKRLQAYL